MMFLPRLCEHCLNPACVASCHLARSTNAKTTVLCWSIKISAVAGVCISGCPYKRFITTGVQAKPRNARSASHVLKQANQPCALKLVVGRIRYLGVLLYDADKIEAAASVANEQDLYQAQLDCFLDPHDPAVIAEARKHGIPES